MFSVAEQDLEGDKQLQFHADHTPATAHIPNRWSEPSSKELLPGQNQVKIIFIQPVLNIEQLQGMSLIDELLWYQHFSNINIVYENNAQILI